MNDTRVDEKIITKTVSESNDSQISQSAPQPFSAYHKLGAKGQAIIWSVLGTLGAIILVALQVMFLASNNQPDENDQARFLISSGPTPSATQMTAPAATATPETNTSTFVRPTTTPTSSLFYAIITRTPTSENNVNEMSNSIPVTNEAPQYDPTATAESTEEPTLTATATFEMADTPAPTATETPKPTDTPIPTATPEMTDTPAPTATETPTPTYVIITSTPTPENVLTAAAEVLQVTAEAKQFGPATPLPSNWVTPVVVTSTPVPENKATAEYLQAVMLTTGTPVPMPANAQTATSTPVFIIVPPLASSTAIATPKATPRPIPAVLLGKIIFLSDREGATEQERLNADQRKATPQANPQPYLFDPATGQVGRLTDIWPYEAAMARDAWSADLTYQAYNKQLLWTNVQIGEDYVPTEELAIHYYDYLYKVERIVTRMGAGIVYDPVWSPVNNEIAFVATESGNDEIWVINWDGTNVRQLTRNQWEWDKRPSWSPDGQQIVFYSNRSGNKQLWIMNKDGGDQRLLMDWNPYNDWDPVWVKYESPAPLLAPEPDWRFIKPPEENGAPHP